MEGVPSQKIVPSTSRLTSLFTGVPVRTISDRLVWRSNTINAPVFVSEKRSAASQIAMMALRQAPLRLGSLYRPFMLNSLAAHWSV